MRSERDIDDYCCSLLDIKSPVHKQFLFDLKKRHRLCKFIFKILYSIFVLYLFLWDLVNQIPSSNIQNTQLPKQNSNSKNQKQEEKTDKKPKVKIILKYYKR